MPFLIPTLLLLSLLPPPKVLTILKVGVNHYFTTYVLIAKQQHIVLPVFELLTGKAILYTF